jgi:hypothetical protein
MSAFIIPFPRTRHRPFVERHAQRMAHLPHQTAEKHLAYQLQLQRQTMSKRGIASAVIECELATLERAIRVELWHFMRSGGGPHEQER